MGSFDRIDHELLMKAVKKHTDSEWEILYIERWLKAPFQKQDGSIIERTSGTPQGGLCKALHKPPYAKKVIMQRKLQNTLKNGVLGSFTLHNIRKLLQLDNHGSSFCSLFQFSKLLSIRAGSAFSMEIHFISGSSWIFQAKRRVIYGFFICWSKINNGNIRKPSHLKV